MNSIAVFAHGKLIHEDILSDLKEGRVFTKYVIGEIDADFMDDNDAEDIVTSARQSVKENDPRYELLKAYVKRVLNRVGNDWTGLRNKIGTEMALKENSVQKWYDRLKGDKRGYAKKMFGRIASLGLPPTARSEVYKANLLAFERLMLVEQLSLLDRIETDHDYERVVEVFGSVDEIEAVHYYEIVKGRLKVIEKFRDIVGDDVKERILQDYLFDHLWLLDASWERAAVNARLEESVTTEFEKMKGKLTEEEAKSRLDIRYQTLSNKHVIIELKRFSVAVDVHDLLKQTNKYRTTLDKCLRENFPEEKDRQIEIICILGAPPSPKNKPDYVRELMDGARVRYVTYDTLIEHALRSYSDYLSKQAEISELIALIDDIELAFRN